jgi:hydroxymethylbilane synthase
LIGRINFLAKVMKKIRIGTRGSKLALAQSEQVRERLQRRYPGFRIELVPIKTTGDKILDAPLSKIGDKGLFTKEIDKELLAGTIDCAVHSMKDVPTELPRGLTIGAVTERLNPCDAFVSKHGKKLQDLRPGDTVATGSLRRKSQLLAYKPGLAIVDMRGNVLSRLKKMRDDPVIAGVILACAGIERLGMTDIAAETILETIIIPAVGQASLAVEIRENDLETAAFVAPLDHYESKIAVSCERAFLAELGGGCQVPIAGLARVSGNTMHFAAMIASLDGKQVIRGTLSDSAENYTALGRNLARKLLDEGGQKILDVIYAAR